MNNIDCFNLACAFVLRKLYLAFPRPLDLLVLTMRKEADLHESCDWEDIQKRDLFSATLDFLEAEGFIRFSSSSGGTAYANVVLTAKGLATLNRTPKSLQTGPTLGEVLAKATPVLGSLKEAAELIQWLLE